MSDKQILIEEIARIALEENLSSIAHELGADEEELQEIKEYLDSKVEE